MAEIKIKADSNGGTVSLKGPATTTGDAAIQLTLPVDDGSANQYLKTDGSGALSWATVVGGITSDGSNNTSGGTGPLANVTTGSGLTAFGKDAMPAYTDAVNSVGIGFNALKVANASGAVAIGKDAGLADTTGQITAIGEKALAANTTAHNNTAVGAEALEANVDSHSLTAVGFRALEKVGPSSSGSAHENTAIGKYAGRDLLTGWNSTFLGNDAQGSSTSASNQITLGNSSVNSLRCNETSIASLSDQRDKTDIVNLPAGLNFVKSLRPVKFKWARRDPNDNDNDGKIRAGFLAQELVTAMGSDSTYLDLIMDDNPDKLEAKIGNLVPVLVQAIKELEARVATLEAG